VPALPDLLTFGGWGLRSKTSNLQLRIPDYATALHTILLMLIIKQENYEHQLFKDFVACLHDQNISGFYGGPAFIQLIRAI